VGEGGHRRVGARIRGRLAWRRSEPGRRSLRQGQQHGGDPRPWVVASTRKPKTSAPLLPRHDDRVVLAGGRALKSPLFFLSLTCGPTNLCHRHVGQLFNGVKH
jgi:hypothetical protein